MDAERKEILKNAETIVIKVGTNVLTQADGTLEPNQVHSLADQIFRLKQAGKKVKVCLEKPQMPATSQSKHVHVGLAELQRQWRVAGHRGADPAITLWPKRGATKAAAHTCHTKNSTKNATCRLKVV